MSSTCHKCKFNGVGQMLSAIIRDSVSDTLVSAREDILRYVGKKCASCRRVAQDDIRIKHTPHNISELQAARQQDERGQVTALPEPIEDTLRRELSALFGLDPIQLLLVQHLVNGNTGHSFGALLTSVAGRVARYRGAPKAQASAMAHAVASKLPILAELMIKHSELE